MALGRARHATGMSLVELAARTGISTSTLSRLESGERRVTIDALERVEEALGTTAAAVLADAAREDRLLLPTPPVELAGGLTGIVLRVEDDGRSLLRITVPVRRVTRTHTAVHPGTEWLHVLRGRLRLRVGERRLDLEPGQTAQFATTEPHAFGGIGGPAEILSRFEPGAHRA
ncbi:MAG: XRE family transcriptional regulator [Egibacteraceae bacterium]